MKLHKYIISIVSLVIFMVSCSSNNVRISQLLFNESFENAYYNGALFTGEAWSDDDKTICISCNNGKVENIKVFHANGNLAIVNTSLVGEGKAYDKDGNEISMAEFTKTYPKVLRKIQQMIDGMYSSPELK